MSRPRRPVLPVVVAALALLALLAPLLVAADGPFTRSPIFDTAGPNPYQKRSPSLTPARHSAAYSVELRPDGSLRYAFVGSAYPFRQVRAMRAALPIDGVTLQEEATPDPDAADVASRMRRFQVEARSIAAFYALFAAEQELAPPLRLERRPAGAYALHIYPFAGAWRDTSTDAPRAIYRLARGQAPHWARLERPDSLRHQVPRGPLDSWGADPTAAEAFYAHFAYTVKALWQDGTQTWTVTLPGPILNAGETQATGPSVCTFEVDTAPTQVHLRGDDPAAARPRVLAAWSAATRDLAVSFRWDAGPLDLPTWRARRPQPQVVVDVTLPPAPTPGPNPIGRWTIQSPHDTPRLAGQFGSARYDLVAGVSVSADLRGSDSLQVDLVAVRDFSIDQPADGRHPRVTFDLSSRRQVDSVLQLEAALRWPQGRPQDLAGYPARLEAAARPRLELFYADGSPRGLVGLAPPRVATYYVTWNPLGPQLVHLQDSTELIVYIDPITYQHYLSWYTRRPIVDHDARLDRPAFGWVIGPQRGSGEANLIPLYYRPNRAQPNAVVPLYFYRQVRRAVVAVPLYPR